MISQSGRYAFVSGKDTANPADATIDISGMRPPGAPEWTYDLIGECTQPNACARLRPEVKDWRARMTWRNAADRFAIFVWGKNLKEDADISNFGPPGPCCTSFAAGFRGWG